VQEIAAGLAFATPAGHSWPTRHLTPPADSWPSAWGLTGPPPARHSIRNPGSAAGCAVLLAAHLSPSGRERLRTRKAKARFGDDTLDLRRVVLDPALVVAASQSPGGGEVVLDVVAQVVLRGRAARRAAKVVWGGTPRGRSRKAPTDWAGSPGGWGVPWCTPVPGHPLAGSSWSGGGPPADITRGGSGTLLPPQPLHGEAPPVPSRRALPLTGRPRRGRLSPSRPASQPVSPRRPRGAIPPAPRGFVVTAAGAQAPGALTLPRPPAAV
jgi:hypothetical protein